MGHVVRSAAALGLVVMTGISCDRTEALSACSETAFDLHMVYVDTSIEDGGKLMGLTPGGERVRLAPHDEVAFSPDFSPNGEELVFASGRDGAPGGAGLIEKELYVVDASGNERRLTVDHFDEDPAWSPDGDWIAFVRAGPGRRTIYKIRPDGTGLEKMADLGRGAGEASPVWSSDGSQLAWLEPHPERRRFVRIAIGDPNGQDVRSVGMIENLTTLDWAPDGERFVAGPGPGNEGVYLVDASSGGSDLLRHDASNAVWDPDGSSVYFWDSTDPEEDRHVLMRRDLDGDEDVAVEGASEPWFLYSGFDIEPMPCEAT